MANITVEDISTTLQVNTRPLAAARELAKKRLTLWQSHSISQYVQALAWLALPAAVAGIIYDASIHSPANVIVDVFSYGLLALVAFYKKVPALVKTAALLLLLYASGVYLLLSAGTGSSQLFLVAVPVMATIYLGRRAGFFGAGLVTVTMLAVTLLRCLPDASQWSPWLISTALMLVISVMLVVPVQQLVKRLVQEFQSVLSSS
jgi:hypothetical protein